MSEPPRLQGRVPSQQQEMPPMPPGFKLPSGVAMPPMPPGMKRQPGVPPIPPNMPSGAPLPPPTAHQHHHHHHQYQHQYQHQHHHHHHQYQHQQHHQYQQHQHQHHQYQQQMPGGGYGMSGSCYPTPPPPPSHHHHHHAHRSVDGREEKYPPPPNNMMHGTNDMYTPRDDRRMVIPPGGDPRGYMPPTAAPPYHQGHYGAPMGYDGDRRGAPHHRNRRDDELRQPTNTVWVGNLDPYEHTEEVLRREFREFGKVIRIAKVPEQSYCFVHFRHVEEARNAVETLNARGTLGRARFNYGKMFEYVQDEMDMSNETNNNHRPPRRGREEERQETDERRRRPRREEERAEPTNVLWIGDLPPTVSSEELNEHFKVFGNIATISRLDNRNMAFIHFETVESCTQALDLMRGQTIGGARVVLNYGRAQRSPGVAEGVGSADGIPPNETPTNVVYLGQFASDVTEEDIEELFEPFEGFINCKFIQSSGIAFGHFDTIDHAREARIALNNALLKGAPVRISFGKSNHTMTMSDRMRRGRHLPPGADGSNIAGSPGGALSPLPAASALGSTGGALVAGPGVASTSGNGAMVVLPAMGVMVGAAGAAAAPQAPTYFTRERPIPEMTLEARLQSLLGATYNCCGEADKPLSPSMIQTICDLIDECIDEESEKRLDDAIFLYTPLNSAHVFGILAKRMHDYYNDDPYKKLYILYAATRVLLGAKTDYLFFTKASINAYLMTLFVASEGQTPAGNDVITSIVENVRRHTFIERQKLDADFIEVFREQLDEILKRVKVDQDLVSLMSKKRRK